MTVRLFVTSAAVMIFSWLAATYLRAVPMDTYPNAPATTVRVAGEEKVLAATSTDDARNARNARTSETTNQ